jgi:hypothetical protein
MGLQSEGNPETNPAKVEAHIKRAQQILKALRQKIGGQCGNRGHPHEAGDGAE